MGKIKFSAVLLIFLSLSAYSQERFRSGVFLHHSTGERIWGPNGSSTSVPDEITIYNNNHGFAGDEACSLNENGWPTDPWNNEWERWHHIFNNEDANADIRPILQANKIVIIKSCFPSSAMTGWGEPSDTANPTKKSVYNYKWHWRNFIRVMESHPENFFMVWTNAPLVADATNDDQAYWSHVFCTWAKDTLAEGLDTIYGAFPKNVYVFDFFHKLAGDDHKLKPEYESSNTDSHPNAAATELVAPQFVKELFDAAIVYEFYYNGGLQLPVLASPSNHASGIARDTTLVWFGVSDTVKYRLQVSTSSGFGPLVLDTILTDTSYKFMGELNGNTTYFWRVKSIITAGEESDWSEAWDFTTVNASGIIKKRTEQFVVYPNPSRGLITIRCKKMFAGDIKTGLYNNQGRLLEFFYLKGGGSIKVNLEKWPPGIYFLKIDNGYHAEIKAIIFE